MKERIKFILYLRGVKESHLVEGHPPFFLVKRRMHFLILGRSVGRSVGLKKKKTYKKRITRSLGIGGAGAPGRR